MEHILLVVSIFGLLLTTILLSKKDGFTDSTRFLAAFYFIISLYCFQTWVIETNRLLQWQWFYGWPLPIYALLAPSLYFYYLSIIKDQFRWSWRYLFLFIPWLFASIDVCLLYMKPAFVYQNIIKEAIAEPSTRFESQYGLFTLKWHFLFRNIWVLGVLFLLFFRLKSFFRKQAVQQQYGKTHDWLKFLFAVVLVLSLFSVYLGVLSILNLNSSQILVPAILMFIFHVCVLLLGVIPLYFPSILYGLPRLIVPENISVSDSKPLKEVETEEGVRFGLNEKEILHRLLLQEEAETYLSTDFTLNKLASILEMPVHHVSYFLNHYYGMSFNDYRNKLRMQKAMQLIKEGFFQQNTIEALAWKCGFASRSAFTKTFKAFAGVNPSEY